MGAKKKPSSGTPPVPPASSQPAARRNGELLQVALAVVVAGVALLITIGPLGPWIYGDAIGTAASDSQHRTAAAPSPATPTDGSPVKRNAGAGKQNVVKVQADDSHGLRRLGSEQKEKVRALIADQLEHAVQGGREDALKQLETMAETLLFTPSAQLYLADAYDYLKMPDDTARHIERYRMLVETYGGTDEEIAQANFNIARHMLNKQQFVSGASREELIQLLRKVRRYDQHHHDAAHWLAHQVRFRR